MNASAPSPARLRLMTDEELELELTSGQHDEPTRSAILFERIRRLTRPASPRPNWVQWATLLVALLAMVLAGIAAYPVIEETGEREWLQLFD